MRHVDRAISRGTSVHWAGGRRHGVQFASSGGLGRKTHIRQVKAQSSKRPQESGVVCGVEVTCAS